MFLTKLDKHVEADNEIEKGLQVLGLEYRKGNGYYQLSCPFAKTSKIHKNGVDRNPSFVLSSNNNYARCFSCGIQFELADFFIKYGEYSNNPADFEYLEFYFPNITDDVEEENPILAESILDGFTESPKIAEYLTARNIDINNLNCKLLYDEEEKRLVYPIRDEYNLLVGATSRAVDNNPYKSHHYFGIQTSKALAGFETRNLNNSILIVEGLTDLLNSLDKINKLKLNFDVYSTLTCSLSQWQALKLIDEDRPIYMAYDMDKAGRKGQYTALKLLKNLGANICVSAYWRERGLDVGDMDYDQFYKLFS